MKRELPLNRKLWRVAYWYFTEGDYWRKDQTILLEWGDAEKEARAIDALNHPPSGKEACVIVDDKAVAALEEERAEKRVGRSTGKRSA